MATFDAGTVPTRPITGTDDNDTFLVNGSNALDNTFDGKGGTDTVESNGTSQNLILANINEGSSNYTVADVEKIQVVKRRSATKGGRTLAVVQMVTTSLIWQEW